MDRLLLKALRCEQTSRPPVWLMRQAGRYLKEYRNLKEKYTFLELCSHPELATEVTLMPMKRFDLDAAILFADILLILQTLDFKIGFAAGVGPQIDTKNYLDKIDSIPLIDVRDTLSYIPKTIEALKKELKTPLLGFCGAPFTLATYLLEGKTSRTFEMTKHWIYSKPKDLHKILSMLTKQSIDYLKMQIHAGVDAIQIFDSWAGFFPEGILQQFSFPYLKEIITAIKPLAPVILFAKGSSLHVKELEKLGPTAISLDDSGNIERISKKLSPKTAIQGNLDPDLLMAPLDILESEVKKMCFAMRSRPGYIFNLGHGIKPKSKVENVQCLIETIQSMSFSEQESPALLSPGF